jgi:hypothetical protein
MKETARQVIDVETRMLALRIIDLRGFGKAAVAALRAGQLLRKSITQCHQSLPFTRKRLLIEVGAGESWNQSHDGIVSS